MAKRTNSLMDLLIASAIAGVLVKDARQQLDSKREGAYTLSVRAAMEAGNAEALDTAYESLFESVRKTGAVTGPDGKPFSLGCKPNKDGTGFLIPSALSSARSVTVDALTRGIPVSEKGEPRSFGSIRKDVQTAAQKEARESATGDKAAHIQANDILSALKEKADGAKGEELARIVRELLKAETAILGQAPKVAQKVPQAAGAAMARAAA